MHYNSVLLILLTFVTFSVICFTDVYVIMTKYIATIITLNSYFLDKLNILYCLHLFLQYSYFFFICVCVCVCVCLVISDSEMPWTIVHQVPQSMEFSGQEYWSGLPFPPPGDLPHPGSEFMPPVSPTLTGRFFTS